MRVIVASLHPRAFSGQVHSLRALARVVGSLGHDVRTITVSLPENPGRLPGSIRYLASTLQVVRSIARDVDGADLVHLNLPTPGFTLLADLLRAIDVLALPYRYPIGQNSFPNVLLEAQGIGVPLVTTDIPVVAEACQEPGTAVLVQSGATEHLAAALASLIEDTGRREEMVRRPRAHYARFAPELLARRYERMYRQVLEGAVSPEHATACSAEQAGSEILP